MALMKKLTVVLALKQWHETKNMAAHVEPIRLQKDSVGRVLKSILLHIEKCLCDIEPSLVPV